MIPSLNYNKKEQLMKRLFKHFHRKPLKEDFIIVTGERDDARKRKAKREKTIKHIGS